tara:strand:- start:175708 stop:176175 length:468 start_codon:yes stop_codon:yes gene_type:complete
MELNEIIEQKVSTFKERLSDKSTSEKKLFHYNSVVNLSMRIILYKEEKANSLKVKLIGFFDEIESCNYHINGKYESSLIHNKYVLPISLYLFKKENFLSNADLRLLTVIGVGIDVILYFLVSGYIYPIFILLFIILGVYRRRQAKKDGKYATMFW